MVEIGVAEPEVEELGVAGVTPLPPLSLVKDRQLREHDEVEVCDAGAVSTVHTPGSSTSSNKSEGVLI